MPDASSSSDSSTIFSAMYKFNYVTPSSSTDAQTQLDHAYSSQNVNMLTMDMTQATHQKPDYGFDDMLSIDTDHFEMLGFNKPQNIFDMGSYMRPDDWSSQCSPTESVFSVDCSRPPTYPTMNGAVDEHQLLSPSTSFPLNDVPNFVSNDLPSSHSTRSNDGSTF